MRHAVQRRRWKVEQVFGDEPVAHVMLEAIRVQVVAIAQPMSDYVIVMIAWMRD